MTQITAKGRELADNAHLGDDRRVLETCSLICRAAITYERVQEDRCNGHPACSSPTLPAATITKLQEVFEERTEKRDEQLSKRIKELALTLPGVKGVNLGGDPRGCTVKLLFVDGRSDDWEGESVCVPGA